VDALRENETLYAAEMREGIGGEILQISDVKIHEHFDFAVAKVKRENYVPLGILTDHEIILGHDVSAYGFTTDGIVNNKLHTVPRYFKGHVVRIHEVPKLGSYRTKCELSFPALKGFSGAPLISNKYGAIVGMIHGSYESTILMHSFSEISEDNKTLSEEIHRVLELGMAHTSLDILHFLDDLGIQSFTEAKVNQ